MAFQEISKNIENPLVFFTIFEPPGAPTSDKMASKNFGVALRKDFGR
jgi:hypothetical protein